ncbi:hypothetical protein BDR26DRAFT_858994 [Obelidium mucronatum]|nr:hypothetical protein BDR26DRAFT_858994 [Obelidium mucronatum]
MIVSAAIFPHGTMILDSTKANLPEGAALLHEASEAAARQVAATSPTAIVLITPHSFSLSHSAAVLMGPEAKGNAEWNGHWQEFEATIKVSGYSAALVENMRCNGLSVEGLTAFSRLPCPLKWAEVVPLHFLLPQLPNVSYIIISPAKGKSIASNLDMGAVLFRFLHSFKHERFAVVVSGDLSHVHETSVTDPIYLPDPQGSIEPNDSVARTFDSLIADWVTGGDRSVLVKSAAGIRGKAKACGYDGLVWLQGGFEALQTVKFKGNVIENLSPTYFGMMVALFKVEKAESEKHTSSWNPLVIIWCIFVGFLQKRYERARDLTL